jgi:enoyl-CoA hydratase/carnithine racemase
MTVKGKRRSVAMSVVLYESKGGIAVITINRPDKANALNQDVAVALRDAWRRFAAADEDRVAILTGAGDRHFSGGADLADPPEIWSFAPGLGVALEKPVIAAVNGWCIGGAVVLVQFCDLCVAVDGARFSYPEAKIGFSGGLITSLLARMPHKVAMEFILVGEAMSAERAYEVGFVNKVVPPAELMPAAMAYAETLAANSPSVMRMLKRHVQQMLPKGAAELAGHGRRELTELRESDDGAEGRAALTEKRKPRFTGR